jgi:hypothetical protein
VATYFGLNQSIIGTLQAKISGIKHLYVIHMAFAFLSWGIPNYKIVLTTEL